MNMQFVVHMNVDNAVFSEDMTGEIRRVLETCMKRLDQGRTYIPLYDVNGNQVGFAALGLSRTVIDELAPWAKDR